MALNLKERDRLKVLHEAEAGHLKQREAAVQLRLSERGFRKLLKRYRAKQDAAVVRALRGAALEPAVEGRDCAAGGGGGTRVVSRLWADAGAGAA